VLQALALSGLAPGAYRLAGISVDPRDGQAAALARRQAYAALLPEATHNLRMLTGDAAALARLQQALGYRTGRDPATGQLAHAAGFVVADSSGRVTRYFSGVRFDPAALRTAVNDADGGQDDQASFADRIVLLCAHFAPSAGVHDAAAMAAVRVVAMLVLLVLAGFIWRRRRRAAGGGA
jgi:protein SCO1/2